MSDWVVRGQVRTVNTRHPVAGLMVVAQDADVLYDDLLGRCETDAEGRFEIRYTTEAFHELGDVRPDVYVEIHGPQGLILSTRDYTRDEAGHDEVFDLYIPEDAAPNRIQPIDGE